MMTVKKVESNFYATQTAKAIKTQHQIFSVEKLTLEANLIREPQVALTLVIEYRSQC
jgi:hypothetical protein